MPPTTRWSLRRRIFVGVVGAIALLWLGSATAVLWHASRDRADKAEAIVVLGAAQYRGRPSPVLRARLDHAIGLYARGLAPRIALTGGTAEGDTASEALVSRAYLLQAGVPDSVLLLENEGRTTSQSLTRVAQMLRSRDLERVILVSDPFHVFRASLVPPARAGRADFADEHRRVRAGRATAGVLPGRDREGATRPRL